MVNNPMERVVRTTTTTSVGKNNDLVSVWSVETMIQLDRKAGFNITEHLLRIVQLF